MNSFVIETDLAELIDDDHNIGHSRLAQQVIEHRRLAAAEKARQQRDRYLLGIVRLQLARTLL